MRFNVLFFTMILTLFALCSFLAVGQEVVTAKKLYRPTGHEATITGTVVFKGRVPGRVRIDQSADPVCAQLTPRATKEDAIVHRGRLANVFVYIRSGHAIDAYSFDAPTSSARLSHKGCRYEPHLLGIRVGQTLAISNEDPTQHNTHPNPRDNAEWNQSQASGSPPILKSFKRAEVFIPFKDNQHPWEKAYVGVFSHPFFAVSDENGYYLINGLPPGHYSLVAWHERFGEKTVEITIMPNEVRSIGFTFAEATRAQIVPVKRRALRSSSNCSGSQRPQSSAAAAAVSGLRSGASQEFRASALHRRSLV